MFKLFKRKSQPNKKRRKGFTLIECVASIAIFAIMGTLFASFMVSSVNVVNLTIANDRDREALLEAISSANSAECKTTNGVVNITAIKSNGQELKLKIDLYDKPVVLEDKYVKYTAPNGTKYSIYLGANAMSVVYLQLLNKTDSDNLLAAVKDKTLIKDLQVTYKDDNQKFAFTADFANKMSIGEIVNGKDGKPEHIKYQSPQGQKYLIFLWKDTTTTP